MVVVDRFMLIWFFLLADFRARSIKWVEIYKFGSEFHSIFFLSQNGNDRR